MYIVEKTLQLLLLSGVEHILQAKAPYSKEIHHFKSSKSKDYHKRQFENSYYLNQDKL
jgi:hypothetical protein